MRIIILLLVIFVFISACTPPDEEVVKEIPEPAGVDIVNEITKTKVIDEEEEIVTDEETEIVSEEEMSEEVKDLFGFADKRVQSLVYRYKGPETKGLFYEFYVNGNKIKYTIDPTFKDLHLDDDAYDTIYINKEFKTALAYCEDRKCTVKGKKAVLDYDEVYIWTSLDWLNNIEFAEKVGEQLINRRSTSKLETGKLGTVWADNYFGVVVQAEIGENLYQFRDLVFNTLNNRDVTPK